MYTNDDTMKSMYKQKYFCQICSRQCRDKDGFKCHIQSITHQRNMEIVSEDPDRFINTYSKEFESGFVDIVKRNYKDIFVSANRVYIEYLNDKDAIHLNGTRWNSLTVFLKHLESCGLIAFQANESETKIKYLDKTPDALQDRANMERKQREMLYEEKKKRKEMENLKQLSERAQVVKVKDEISNTVSEFVDPGNIKIEFKKTQINDIKHDYSDDKLLGQKRKQIDGHDKVKFDKDQPWIDKGLIVKIKDKSLTDYLDKKGLIINIQSDYVAELKLSDGKKLKIDQAYLEPVLPNLNNEVKILYGDQKHETGILLNTNLPNTADVKLKGDTLTLDIRGICKYTQKYN
jgi:DNA/RNA-binding protein KIN17